MINKIEHPKKIVHLECIYSLSCSTTLGYLNGVWYFKCPTLNTNVQHKDKDRVVTNFAIELSNNYNHLINGDYKELTEKELKLRKDYLSFIKVEDLRPLAHKLIVEHYTTKGKTIKLLIQPEEYQNIPEEFYTDQRPIVIDLLAGRPINLEFFKEQFEVDLCFTGPQQRCVFRWEDVLAVMVDSKNWMPTIVSIKAIRLEDDSLRATTPKLPEKIASSLEPVPSKKPKLSLVH